MKRDPYKPKPEPSTNAPLELLHMDLCGPMRTQSLGGKKYIPVIVDDYSRYTCVKFLRSKDETPDVLVTFLKTTQNRSMIHRRFKKTPYALINNRTPKIKYFHIFGCKCFVLNDRESLNKFSAKASEGIFIGYSSTSTAYRIYLKKSKTVIESINIMFDEEMASEQHSSEPVITGVLASRQLSPEPAYQQNKSDEASTSTNHISDLDLLFELFYDEFLGSNVKKSVVADRMEDSTTTHPTSSDIPIESNTPIQQEIPIQMPTPTVEEVTCNEETEVAEIVGFSVQINLQPDQAIHVEPSEPTTSTAIIIPPEQT
ncbi:hypothetical protein L6452_22284 [Arctium lappa]|uniref:Uncharacterized protein n=1 Tax=Arctium lappa TaxID=4217 RepID=A0ACB9B084_ARCLA|nr:hypothetical protein L6452_22284 [Arctium lappa]